MKNKVQIKANPDQEDIIIFGRNAVYEYLQNKGALNKVLLLKTIHRDEKIQRILENCQEQRVPYHFVPQEKLKSIAGSQNHQGLVAYGAPFRYPEPEDFLESLDIKSNPKLLLLDEIQDPHNLGAIIRSAVAAAAQGIIISKHRSTSVTAAVVKASAGLVQHIPVVRVTNLTQFIHSLKNLGFWVYGTSLNAEKDWNQVHYDLPVALILGNEGKGLSKAIAKHCDVLVKIPMPGPAESLNVSVSAALMLFKINEKRSLANSL
jgi:23S rRNA (guanosine2251-2'-O)-methyltransferase